MAGQRPRKGWIYMINPYRVSLRCSNGHQHIYNLDAPSEIECQTVSCDLMINSSRVFRGTHPHIIWSSDKFRDDSGFVQTFTAIPLSSQTTFRGLPTTYPIMNTVKNGLEKRSYALVHQICTVEGNCFKTSDGSWLERVGQLETNDRLKIDERLKYFLGFDNQPNEDWLKKNASPDLVQKMYSFLPNVDKKIVLEKLLDDFELDKDR